MRTSEKGIALIKSFEGCRLTAYLCPSGVWTIGYGHTERVTQGQTITQAYADSFLKADLEKYEKYVTATGLALNQNQFDALVSFTYNCGAGNLKKLIANRTLPEISEAMLLYNKGGGKVLTGLVRRREAERKLFLEEVKTEVEYQMVKPVDYKQNDSKWGGLSYAVDGERSTVKSAGCGPTSLADVLAAIVSQYIDPVTLASWARYHNYKIKNCGTSYSFFVPCAKAFGVTVRRLNTSNVYGIPWNGVHEQALAELRKGNWLIACMGKGNWTSSGHYIVVYGYEDGYVYINDPASTAAKRAKNTWELLRSQVKYYWAVEVPESIKQNGIVNDGAYRHEDFVREVQYCTGATPDGKSGTETLSKTITVSAKKNRTHFVVMPLQKLFRNLGYYAGNVDKVAGKLFTDAVNKYQDVKLLYTKPDGEITARGKMWRHLLGIL